MQPVQGTYASSNMQQTTTWGSGNQPTASGVGLPQNTGAGGFNASPSSMSNAQGALMPTEYRASEEQLFYLSEKMMSFSKDDFNIKNINGHTIFKVDAALLSIKGARALTDANKHTILTMQHKILGSGTWEIYKGNASTDEKLAIVKKPHGIGKMMSSHQGPVVNVHFAHGSSVGGAHATPDMVVVGDVMGKGYTIMEGNRMVAEVSRALAVKTSRFNLGSADAYAVKVLPGSDCALMLALAVIIDELFH